MGSSNPASLNTAQTWIIICHLWCFLVGNVSRPGLWVSEVRGIPGHIFDTSCATYQLRSVLMQVYAGAAAAYEALDHQL